eukprot:tig00000145_g8832.t1
MGSCSSTNSASTAASRAASTAAADRADLDNRGRTLGSAADRSRSSPSRAAAAAAPVPAPSAAEAPVIVHGVPVRLGSVGAASVAAAPGPVAAAGPAARSGAPAAGRALRVFVSSTFQDMMAERDEIRAVVHPRLRALCAERGLFLHIGDLRSAPAARARPFCASVLILHIAMP